MWRSEIKFSWILFIVFYLIEFTIGGEHQRRLLKYLLDESDHNPLERPVYNDSLSLTVTMNLALQQIIDFDEKNEILMTSGWVVLTWHDYSLQWEPEDFGNIQTIRIPSTRVWTPDILLYNSADDNFEGTMKTNLVVQANGSILFAPPGIFKSICPFNIGSFPFVNIFIFEKNSIQLALYSSCIFLDVQNCTLKFGSWSFDESGVNLTVDGDHGQRDAYVENGEWDLENFIAFRQALVYECCPTVYPFVLFTIQIRRRTLYYVINIVVPCVLISFMTVLGFLLPPDSGEKLTLQITILLSIVMFSLLISGIIPASSNAVPTIVMYFTTVMGMCSMSVIATVVVLDLHHKNAKNHTMPMWIHVYINQYLAWFLRMKRPGHDLSWKAIRHRHFHQADQLHNTKILSTPLLEHSSKSLLANIINTNEEINANSTNQLLIHEFDTRNFYRSDLRMILSELKFMTDYVRREEEEDDISQDWKFSAMVIDRLCLVLFTILTTIFSYVTLFSAPNFFKLR